MSDDVHADHGKMAPLDQKHPNDRAHFWDYHNPRLTPPAAAVDRAFPRVVYKANPAHEGPDHPGNDVRRCADAQALEQALADGWQAEPVQRPA